MNQSLETLFPGEAITVEGIDITVFPVGVAHLRQFNRAVEEVLPKIASQMDLGKMGEVNLKDLGPMVIPILLSDVLDLINDCVVGVNLTDKRLPHWVLAPIVQKWIEVSFGSEKKIRPWIEVVETTVMRMTGESPGIWDTLCQSRSAKDTISNSSSTDNGETAPTEDGLSPS